MDQLDFRPLVSYLPSIIFGIWITVKLAVVSTAVGTTIGVFVGVALHSYRYSQVLVFLNDCVRAVPLIVLMFFLYYTPFDRVFSTAPLSPFTAAALALSISQASFSADLVRSAIANVSSRTVEAAVAIGLKDRDVYRYIVLPDVLRQILPPTAAFFIGNIKLSSIAAVIGCEDVVFVTRVAVSQTYRSTESWLLVAIVYVALVVPLSWASRWLERRAWIRRR